MSIAIGLSVVRQGSFVFEQLPTEPSFIFRTEGWDQRLVVGQAAIIQRWLVGGPEHGLQIEFHVGVFGQQGDRNDGQRRAQRWRLQYLGG